MIEEQTIPKQLLDMASVQQDAEDKLLALDNVVGVALGNRVKEKKQQETDEPVLSVLVSHKLAPELLSDKAKVPKKVKDCATDVVEVGEIFAGAPPDSGVLPGVSDQDQDVATPLTLRRRVRPAMGGYSCGHFRITAGTLGTCCYDLSPFPSIPSKYYILSNNHVLANSNNARIGDPILQPGPIDGGTVPNDVIARLSRFIPIQFVSGSNAPCNYVDCAVAEGNFEDLNREIYWVGYVRRLYAAPVIGDIVQ